MTGRQRPRITVSLAQVTSSRGWGGEGGRGVPREESRYEGPPLPCSKNKEKYHMGCSDHLQIRNAAHHQRHFNTLKLLITPTLGCITVPWLHIPKAPKGRLSWPVCSLKSLLLAPSKSPTKTWTSLRSHLNAGDNSSELFDHCVYP